MRTTSSVVLYDTSNYYLVPSIPTILEEHPEFDNHYILTTIDDKVCWTSTGRDYELVEVNIDYVINFIKINFGCEIKIKSL